MELAQHDDVAPWWQILFVDLAALMCRLQVAQQHADDADGGARAWCQPFQHAPEIMHGCRVHARGGQDRFQGLRPRLRLQGRLQGRSAEQTRLFLWGKQPAHPPTTMVARRSTQSNLCKRTRHLVTLKGAPTRATNGASLECWQSKC